MTRDDERLVVDVGDERWPGDVDESRERPARSEYDERPRGRLHELVGFDLLERLIEDEPRGVEYALCRSCDGVQRAACVECERRGFFVVR